MTLANLNFSAETATLMASFGVDAKALAGGTLSVRSPINGETIAAVAEISADDTRKAIDAAHQAFLEWRLCRPRSVAN